MTIQNYSSVNDEFAKGAEIISENQQLDGEGSVLDKSIPFSKIKDGLRVVEFTATIAANKGTPLTIFNKVKAGKWVLKDVSIELTQVPDASATTLTVMVEHVGGTDALSSALSFAEGTDVVGAIQDGAIVTTANRIFTETEKVNILIGGTSVVLGAVKGTLVFLEL